MTAPGQSQVARHSAAWLCSAGLLLVAACSTPTLHRDSGPSSIPRGVLSQPEPVPRDLPLSTSGNSLSYVVFGKRYYRLQSAHNYVADGIASWYGRKFHGRPTASGEIYDMYALTAAHRSLPLPAYVRVTNVGNGKSVVVKVNDRGPFVGNRIIDLSYAAAARLDMLHYGTAKVRVETLSGEARRGAVPTVAAAPATQPATPQPVLEPQPLPEPYLQVGAFGSFDAADRLSVTLQGALVADVFIVRFPADALYRVRLGPFSDLQRQRQAAEQLRAHWQLQPVAVSH